MGAAKAGTELGASGTQSKKIKLPVQKMNQPYACVNQSYTTHMLASALRNAFRVQMYKNNAREILSRILSILNSDWL